MSGRVAGADSNSGGLSSETEGGRATGRGREGGRGREREMDGVRRRRGSHGRVQCGAGQGTYDTPVLVDGGEPGGFWGGGGRRCGRGRRQQCCHRPLPLDVSLVSLWG